MASAAEQLDEILRRFEALPEDKQREIEELAALATAAKRWVPNPGPQTEAYLSPADELFYGGAAGGGKTALLCGAAVNDHQHAHIFRREGTQLRGLIEELQGIIGSRDGFNGQDKIWRVPGGGTIELGGIKDEDDKEKWQGRAADLKGFDEVTHFSEAQYRYIIGWNRSADQAGQRCRVIATGNPPLTAEGAWVISYWGPWLDPNHPDPAKPGELRWFTTIDGKDRQCPGPEPITINGLPIRPRSRTFISSSLEDNPDLMDSGYAAVLEGMPEPLRTMLREGRFDVGQQDDEWQVVPSAWIREAQSRWTPDGCRNLRMTAVACDVAQGGADDTTLAPRYGGWFAELEVKPGVETPDSPTVAALIALRRRDNAAVVVDVGGGYGGGVVSYLKDNGTAVIGFNASHASTSRTCDGQLTFKNKRAETWWKFREALDPSQAGGSLIALPPDAVLVADLTAPHWHLTPQGILIEPKDKIRERIGRSTDRGDAVVMCWSEGEALAARQKRAMNGPLQTKANLGHANLKARSAGHGHSTRPTHANTSRPQRGR